MPEIDANTQRFLELHTRAAHHSWILGKHPTETTYMLVSAMSPHEFIARDRDNAYGLTLDEVEHHLDEMDTPPSP